jgi:hypothetical protein
MSNGTKIQSHNVKAGNIWSAGGQLYNQISQGITDAMAKESGSRNFWALTLISGSKTVQDAFVRSDF